MSLLAPAARLVILTAFSCQSADYLTLLFQRSSNMTFDNVAIANEKNRIQFFVLGDFFGGHYIFVLKTTHSVIIHCICCKYVFAVF
jgi:hypothetical protein